MPDESIHVFRLRIDGQVFYMSRDAVFLPGQRDSDCPKCGNLMSKHALCWKGAHPDNEAWELRDIITAPMECPGGPIISMFLGSGR